MINLVLFLNSFLSYLLLMAIIVVICGIAVFIGIRLRKRKNSQQETEKIDGTPGEISSGCNGLVAEPDLFVSYNLKIGW